MSIRGALVTMRLRRRRDEKGAYAILFSMMLVMVIALAAIAVDIASNVASKQQLKDTMDAAAHAAAFELDGNAANAANVARQVARANDLNADPTIDFWCVVSSMGETRTANQNQIPGTCNPGPLRPVTVANYPGMVCDEVLCFIPCVIGSSTKCNTIRIADKKVVPYAFAPAIGYDEGSTGAVVSVACKGSCGTESPNPLDIVIMADRTASMAQEDREAMKSAILRSLETMNPEMHHVAFGALHKSRTSGFSNMSEFDRPAAPRTPAYEDCSRYRRNSWERYYCNQRNDQKTAQYEEQKRQWEQAEQEFSRSVGWNGSGDTNGDGICRTEATRTNGSSAANTRTNGTWVPVNFTKDYLKLDGTVNPLSALVDGVSCLGESPSGEYGTHLAGALKGAARHLLAGSQLPGASARPGQLQKVIIFETDGQPDEVGDAGGSTSLSIAGDIFGGQQSTNTNSRTGTKGCQNFLDVARNAKDAGIKIITIGFGDANTAGCQRYFDYDGEPLVRNVLASAASPVNGVAASAGRCRNDTEIADENGDGDYYFCAAEGDELAEIFATAMTAMSGGIKLLKMPS